MLTMILELLQQQMRNFELNLRPIKRDHILEFSTKLSSSRVDRHYPSIDCEWKPVLLLASLQSNPPFSSLKIGQSVLHFAKMVFACPSNYINIYKRYQFSHRLVSNKALLTHLVCCFYQIMSPFNITYRSSKTNEVEGRKKLQQLLPANR